MQEESYIPVQIEKFWANNSNKENLQKLAKEFFINKSIENQIMLFLVDAYQIKKTAVSKQ